MTDGAARNACKVEDEEKSHAKPQRRQDKTEKRYFTEGHEGLADEDFFTEGNEGNEGGQREVRKISRKGAEREVKSERGLGKGQGVSE
jgi:hypothetical protein